MNTLRVHRTGFTLIEILVVISIIAVLASVIISSLGESRQRATEVADKEAVRQVKLAMELYALDHGDYPWPENYDENIIDSTSDTDAWQQVANQLISGGYIKSIPNQPQRFAYIYTKAPFSVAHKVVEKGDGGGAPPVIPGCTDHGATNHNPNATEDDGTCEYEDDNGGGAPPVIPGCTDHGATNHNPNATEDDGTCEYEDDNGGGTPPVVVEGCTDLDAHNHNPNATEDDGTCTYVGYFVHASGGNNSNDGKSPDKAWRTLSHAVSQLSAGDTLKLARGETWSEALVINNKSGNASNLIVVKSYGQGDRPRINGGGSLPRGINVNNSNYVSISDIFVYDFQNTINELHAGVWVQNSNFVVLHNLAVVNGVGWAGLLLLDTNNTEVRNVVVRNNTTQMAGVLIFSQFASKGNNNRVRNSEIFDNNKIGIQLFANCSGCGSGNIVSNNETHNNGANGIGVFMSNSVVQDNIVSNNGSHGIALSGEEIDLVNNNLIKNNTVFGNCQKQDDCFGIDFFRVGVNNVAEGNIVSGQNDTLADTSVPINPGYNRKLGTGGIRFDGGDIAAAFDVKFNDPKISWKNSTGNRMTANIVSDEHQGLQVFNHTGVTLQNNTLSNNTIDIWLGAHNIYNFLFTSGSLKSQCELANCYNGTYTRPIDVSLSGNSFTPTRSTIYSCFPGNVTVSGVNTSGWTVLPCQ